MAVFLQVVLVHLFGTIFKIFSTPNNGGEIVIGMYQNGNFIRNILCVDANGNWIDGVLMPQTGGTFTGNVAVPNENRAGNYLRNIEVYEKTHTDFVSTNILVAVRK